MSRNTVTCLSKAHRHIRRVEELLMMIYSYTTDPYVRDRIVAEFTGTPDDKYITSRLLKRSLKDKA